MKALSLLDPGGSSPVGRSPSGCSPGLSIPRGALRLLSMGRTASAEAQPLCRSPGPTPPQRPFPECPGSHLWTCGLLVCLHGQGHGVLQAGITQHAASRPRHRSWKRGSLCAQHLDLPQGRRAGGPRSLSLTDTITETEDTGGGQGLGTGEGMATVGGCRGRGLMGTGSPAPRLWWRLPRGVGVIKSTEAACARVCNCTATRTHLCTRTLAHTSVHTHPGVHRGCTSTAPARAHLLSHTRLQRGGRGRRQGLGRLESTAAHAGGGVPEANQIPARGEVLGRSCPAPSGRVCGPQYEWWVL